MNPKIRIFSIKHFQKIYSLWVKSDLRVTHEKFTSTNNVDLRKFKKVVKAKTNMANYIIIGTHTKNNFFLFSHFILL